LYNLDLRLTFQGGDGRKVLKDQTGRNQKFPQSLTSRRRVSCARLGQSSEKSRTDWRTLRGLSTLLSLKRMSKIGDSPGFDGNQPSGIPVATSACSRKYCHLVLPSVAVVVYEEGWGRITGRKNLRSHGRVLGAVGTRMLAQMACSTWCLGEVIAVDRCHKGHQVKVSNTVHSRCEYYRRDAVACLVGYP